MLNYTPPYSFWSVWLYFSTWERLFLVALGVLSVYALFSAAITVSCVRKTRAAIHKENSADVEHTFLALRKRSKRLQKLIGAAFYFFGMVLFLSLQWAYFTADMSSTPGAVLVLRNFAPHFVFAFNVFLVFLILHVLGWFISICADAFDLQLTPRQLA
jgi:hypothetical protein